MLTASDRRVNASTGAATSSGRGIVHVNRVSSIGHVARQRAVSAMPGLQLSMMVVLAVGKRAAAPVLDFAKRKTSGRTFTVAADDATDLPTSGRLQTVLDGLDQLNSKDPRSVEVDGQQVPYELAYARWLTGWVLQLCAAGGVAPSEELRIAARGQHVERWQVPRNSYPEGRTAYLQWREDLKKRHAATTTGIMAGAGYGPDSCKRVEQLILKRALRETEGQILEDGLCLVFLERQFAEFLPKLAEDAGGDVAEAEAKIVDILQKSWKKMGPLGRQAALGLPLEPRLAELVGRALEAPPPTSPPIAA